MKKKALPRPTVYESEKSVAAHVLSDWPARPEGFLAKVIVAAPSSFLDERLGPIVALARDSIAAGRPGDLTAMRKAADCSLVAELTNTGVSAGLAESDAHKVWQAWHARELSAFYRDGQKELDADPSAALASAPGRLRYLADMVESSVNGEAGREVLIRAWSLSQIAAHPEPAGMQLVGDYHITLGAMTVIGGQPGVGKSSALHSLAFAGANGSEWFGMTVARRFRTLVVQSENGLVRLQREFADRDIRDLDDYVRITEPPPCGLAFGRPDFQAEIRRLVAEFEPDVFALDPFSNVTFGDKKSDFEDAFAGIMACLPKGDAAPAIVVVAHTRKPQGDERKSGRALLHLLSGSLVLGSRPRSVFIMQPGSDDTDDRRIIWTCAKNNDGDLGPRSAWERNAEGFERVRDFDWNEFDGRDGGGRPAKVEWDDIATLLAPGQVILKRSLVREMVERFKCSEPTAYRTLDKHSPRLSVDRDGFVTRTDHDSRNPHND